VNPIANFQSKAEYEWRVQMDKTLACVAIGGTIAIRTIYFMYKYHLGFDLLNYFSDYSLSSGTVKKMLCL